MNWCIPISILVVGVVLLLVSLGLHLGMSAAEQRCVDRGLEVHWAYKSLSCMDPKTRQLYAP